MIDRDNYHGFWPLLYQVATAGLGPTTSPIPSAPSTRSTPTCGVRLGTVSGVDLDARLVEIDGELACRTTT